MDQNISSWMVDTMVLVLIALATLAMVSAIAAVRAINRSLFEVFTYLTISLFLSIVHLVWLLNPSEESVLFYHANLTFWHWLVFIFSPALIIVFLFFAFFWYSKEGVRPAMTRMFFGLTLICLLYMIGDSWSEVARGLLSIIWFFLLFKIEFPSPPPKPVMVYRVRRLL